MKQQVLDMLQLQDAINTKVHPQWREQNYAWYRAVWVECAELMDHYGWKWWKHQAPDMDQVILELVDIWHFGLSIHLIESQDLDLIAQQVVEQLESAVVQEGDFKDLLEDFAGETIRSKGFDIGRFALLMAAVDLSFEGLYQNYIGKNVLNRFRQDHGYKAGTYQKVWGAKEDNEHLSMLLGSLDCNQEGFTDVLYAALSERYTAQGS
ncbi:MAG: dUTP diphosphatase [Alteromonadaceae bacterium]|nr:MAG: dUTP diphosphatase [Alteromonadaceae bacterium]